jgi:DNA-binding Xre family transcriptional regulator
MLRSRSPLHKDILQRYVPLGSMLESPGSARKSPMVRLRIHQIMKTRKISAYALSKGTNLSYPSAYRLSRAGGAFGRLHSETLNTLCHFFHLQPGKLLEWVP